MDEEFKKQQDEDEFLAEIMNRVTADPSFLKKVIDAGLYAHYRTAKLAQKQLNETGLLFSVVSDEEKARWLKQGIQFDFLKGGGLDHLIDKPLSNK